MTLKEYIETLFKGIRLKENKIMFKGTVVGSKLYPLNSKQIDMFSSQTTELLENDKLIEAVNAVKVEQGRCYTNISNLKDNCSKLGIEDIKTYVGWVAIIGDNRIVHHCWAVYKDVHIIDFSMSNHDIETMLEINKLKLSNDEAREFVVNNYIKRMKLPNTENFTFGTSCEHLFYMGCECEPHVGLEIYKDMMNKFPDHPSYRNLLPSGVNKTNKLMTEKLKRGL